MADLSKIKVGDSLKFTARIGSVDGDGEMIGLVRPDSEDPSCQFYLGGRWIAAAEHIPAPRVFNWGDKVRLATGERGLVLGPVLGEPDTYWTTWFDNRSSPWPVKSRVSELEPDEALE